MNPIEPEKSFRCCTFPIALVLLLALFGCEKTNNQPKPVDEFQTTKDSDTSSAKEKNETGEKQEKAEAFVLLVIDFAGESENIEIEWAVESSKSMSVLELMELASEGDQGFEFIFTGSGETAFLKSINGINNEGAGGKNWVYRVNEELAETSFGVCQVESGDSVSWKLGSYEPE